MNYILFMALLVFSFNAQGTLFFDLSLGGVYKDLKGDSNSYNATLGPMAEASVGLKGERWDFKLEGSYSYGRQKDLTLNYDSVLIRDDFNWHNMTLGPTLNYRFASTEKGTLYSSFGGLFVNYASFTNRIDLRDEFSNRSEDADHDMLGYGVKLGLMMSKPTREGSWIDSINYKVYGAYTKHQSIEGDYFFDGRVRDYKGNTPDNLSDISIGFLVGFSIGENIWNKAKSMVSSL
jgi:hypothetical protein